MNCPKAATICKTRRKILNLILEVIVIVVEVVVVEVVVVVVEVVVVVVVIVGGQWQLSVIWKPLHKYGYFDN